MTREDAKHKLDFMKKSYQKLIDEKVDSGKLVGDGVRGEWKAETPLDEAYKSMIDALELAIKSLEQQPTDAVDRATIKEYLDSYNDVPDINIGKIGKDATATDCVKRQDVEDAIYDYSRSCDVNYAQIMEFIDKLPSVQPKIGHWVKVIEENGHAFYLCSVCKEGTDENYDWCPFCGCKMQEVKNE